MADNIEITDAPEQHRFEARIEGTLAGFATYDRGDDLVTYPHTSVLPAYEGQGVGGALARAAMDDARGRSLRVRPSCPFIAHWITLHPAYADLV